MAGYPSSEDRIIAELARIADSLAGIRALLLAHLVPLVVTDPEPVGETEA